MSLIRGIDMVWSWDDVVMCLLVSGCRDTSDVYIRTSGPDYSIRLLCGVASARPGTIAVSVVTRGQSLDGLSDWSGSAFFSRSSQRRLHRENDVIPRLARKSTCALTNAGMFIAMRC